MATDTAPDVQPYPGYGELRFETRGGDGEPSLLHQVFVLQRVPAPWFKGSLGKCGPAWLMRVIEGPRKGLLLAFTPRGSKPIEDALLYTSKLNQERLEFLPTIMSPEEIEALRQGPRFRSYATVVMHRIDVVGPDFRGDDSDTYAAGMTVLEQLKRRDTIN